MTKKVASYANLENLLHRMAREEKKENKIFENTSGGERLQHLNPCCTQVKNPERKTGAAFLFCSLAARYPPDLPGPAAFFAAASTGDSPRTADAAKLNSF